jgi:hypothetical protein
VIEETSASFTPKRISAILAVRPDLRTDRCRLASMGEQFPWDVLKQQYGFVRCARYAEQSRIPVVDDVFGLRLWYVIVGGNYATNA